MNPIQALILGVIQGLTEFLPVSSTAHLLIGQKLMGIPANDAIFSFLVIVQLGTILSLIVYFSSELWKIVLAVISNFNRLKDFRSLPFDARLGWYILLATIPALIAGFLFKDMVEMLFANQLLEASIRLLAAAFLMVLAEYLGKQSRKLDSITWLDGLFIGVMQIIAVFPGASRSGTTISAGLIRNFDRPSAARFAFLMSVPVMAAAGAYESISLIRIPGLSQILPALIIGFMAAAVVGWFAVRWFMGYLSKHSLHTFAVYCLLVGLVCLVFSII
ncbi:MAG: undecaprenyl-diphosphatase UppP [Chloroflexi bacterium GWB2_49_20]|nr:MAG: undecaprenyl-diphosphatase UppP [Chloroflexi bacterium GWB2_49_20]OGN76102.1 MAG: undecaprenyl-diphosphatase UppP [Chloroflexi bacterium GWC2_49_37]OGN83488.1 MAG: undecaprenyl-diphosphatase UppP [Chloroflexi bacterium GWD2_49_16]HBG73888.1 undecaprenyl-diphosphatase UppP [Anaerolineae bacterium]HCC79533.1 undecaprenyl-diphosphatase UppP [Anaerolineae bacterium]